VSDQQYFEALTPRGLALAEEQARRYLTDARIDEDLPTRDVARGLVTIQSLQSEEVRRG